MPALTRGPLPARVYWVRRLAVLGVALLMVVGVARLLGDSSDASSDEGRATQVAADSSGSSSPGADDSSAVATGPASPTTPQGDKGDKKKDQLPKKTKTSDAPVLVAPNGPCAGSDVAVTPKVEQAIAGRDVLIVLQLRTLQSEACTWRVSSNVLTMDITSGKDAIWSSRDCPGAIPRRDVVVRRSVTSTVGVVWKQAKRSGEQCTLRTDWALPGYYHVTASALAGEPSDVQFELGTPTAATVTKTADPKQSPTAG